MAGCSCSCGNTSFSTYEWITMILQAAILLCLALILFAVDEKIQQQIN